MTLILNIETATKTCSVALAKDGEVISFKEQHGEYAHAENLTLFIDEVIKKSKIEYAHIDAIAVSKGPGSYTGLRIGVSTAKGLCFALNKPLLAVNTLESMATQIKNNSHYILCPMIDARRMEVYCALFDSNINVVKSVSAEIIEPSSFKDFLQENKIVFFGDGAEKCKKMLEQNNNAIFIDNFNISASGMAKISNNLFLQNKFENLAYFEPFYLKDFVATTPKKLI